MIGATAVVRTSKPLGNELAGYVEMVTGWLVPAYTTVSSSMSGDVVYMVVEWMHGMQATPGCVDIDLSIVVPEALGFDLEPQAAALAAAYQRVFGRRYPALRFRVRLYVGHVDQSAVVSTYSQTGHDILTAERRASFYLGLCYNTT